jgi:hypothetical protein
MSTIERKGFAFLSACGITATIFTYIVSFSGVTSEATSHWEIVLIVGAFVVLIPMAVVERTRLSGRTFSFKEFGRGRPGWMMLCIKLFWVIAVAHVIWFYLRYSGGVPTVEHVPICPRQSRANQGADEIGVSEREGRRAKVVRELNRELLSDGRGVLVVPAKQATK